MRHARSSLGSGGFTVLIAAGVCLFLLLCTCVMLSNHLLPRYGMNVRPASTHFLMSSYDRNQTHILTITPGAPPCYYLEGRMIPGGIEGVEKKLQSWDCATPSHVCVLLVADQAVPSGDVQRLTDRILLHGFTCMIAGRPETTPQ